MNNDEQNQKIYDGLKAYHQLAVDLRASGHKYDEIAADPRIDAKEHTVRTWFMKGGICYEAYEEKKKILQSERQEKLEQVEDGIVDLATGTGSSQRCGCKEKS